MPHTLTELVMGMVPTITDDTRGFWAGTLEEKLNAQRCNACGNVQLPPSPCCSTCLSQDLSWETLSGTGRVFSFTVVRHAFHPAFAEKIPYVVADIALDEGPIITSTVTDVPVEQVSIGMAVRVWFDDEQEDAFHQKLRLPKFRPE